jgi:hypothetical protein
MSWADVTLRFAVLFQAENLIQLKRRPVTGRSPLTLFIYQDALPFSWERGMRT